MANEPEVPQEEAEEGAPEWVVTFGDMMSLLLTFFIMLLSFSQMDAAKFKLLAGSMEKAFGVQKKNPVYEQPKGIKLIFRDFDQAFIEQAQIGEQEKQGQEILDRLNEQLEKVGVDELKDRGLFEMESQDDQIIMRLMGQSTFDSGSAAIKPDMIPILMKIGEVIDKSTWDVIVAGHTDNVPIRGGIYQSNLELSAARAASVVKFFVAQELITPEKIATMAFGEYRPLVPNDSPENRQRNRRVEIILTRLSTSSVEEKRE